MNIPGRSALKRILIETLGWLLIIVGLAALVLPGPGLLALFAGMAFLATQYEWAERRVEPIKKSALQAAEQSVASWFNIALSFTGVFLLISFGVVWGTQPAVPDWWPLNNSLWLPGGWGTGGTLIGSGIIAAAMIVFSFIKFRQK